MAQSDADLAARVIALEASLLSLRELLNERDIRYSQRADSQDKAVNTAMTSATAAVAKAETATEKRLEGLNELRAMADGQAATFARSEEMKLVHQAIEKRMDTQGALVQQMIARGGGLKEAWGYIVGAAGLVALAATYLHR